MHINCHHRIFDRKIIIVSDNGIYKKKLYNYNKMPKSIAIFIEFWFCHKYTNFAYCERKRQLIIYNYYN